MCVLVDYAGKEVGRVECEAPEAFVMGLTGCFVYSHDNDKGEHVFRQARVRLVSPQELKPTTSRGRNGAKRSNDLGSAKRGK